MKRFFTKNINKVVILSVLVMVILCLTSCRTNASTWYDKPYTSWYNEFAFVNDEGNFSFWQALLGWPVSILSYPFAWLMGSIGKGLGDSYFWGIVFTTLIVRTIAWPIYSKQNSTSVKMQLIQPELEKLQRKYNGRRDPESQQRMQQETMKIYRKYKVNPLGCGFTMILQFPIFMAMYECVRRIQVKQTVSIDGIVTAVKDGAFTLSNTKLFNYFEINSSVLSSGTSGVPRASTAHDIIFGIVIALLFTGVSILSQKLAQRKPSYMKQRPRQVKSEQQVQQEKMGKMMQYIMSFMFFFMALSSTALGVYWLVGGIYQLGQSQIGRKINEHNYNKMRAKHDNIISSK